MSLESNPAMPQHTPRWGAAQWELQDGRPMLPVPGEAGSCLQAAVTAARLHEPPHQAPTSMGVHWE